MPLLLVSDHYGKFCHPDTPLHNTQFRRTGRKRNHASRATSKLPASSPSQQTQLFGSFNSNKYLFTGSWCDCREIQVADPNVYPGLYVSDSIKLKTIKHKKQTSPMGAVVRLFGKEVWGSEGTVKDEVYDYTSETCDCSIIGSTLADYIRLGGDSGGAITANNKDRAAGMHSGKSQGYGRFFEVANIESMMNVSIWTN